MLRWPSGRSSHSTATRIAAKPGRVIRRRFGFAEVRAEAALCIARLRADIPGPDIRRGISRMAAHWIIAARTGSSGHAQVLRTRRSRVGRAVASWTSRRSHGRGPTARRLLKT